MRLSYPIRFEDFKSLQRPFTLRAGKNAGFKGVLVACVLMALLGVFCLLNGFGILVAGFLIGLGAAAAGAAYLYDKRTIAAKEHKYEQDLKAGYQRIHCRDERVLEADQNGLTMSCKCEKVSRPWSELASFSENDKHFAFGTKMGMQVLPKSAFASPADITEFRALVYDQLNQGRPMTAPHFDVILTEKDYRSARLVHRMKGGGWRYSLRVWATYAFLVGGAYVLWNSMAGRNDVVRAGVIGGLLAFPLNRVMKKRRFDYLGKVRVYFSEQGIFAEYPSTQSRRAWSEFVGYLENDDVLLLYLSPKLYTVVPRRALTGPASQFRTLVGAKLPSYDYRNPLSALKTQPAP